MEITQEFLKEKFEYRDGHLWYRKRTQGVKEGMQAGHLNSRGYIQIEIGQKRYYEHILVFLYHYGYFPKDLDHINRCGSDNHIENLREATKRQNQGNRKIQKGASSRFKGVSFYSRKQHLKNPWIAGIGLNGRTRHLGSFISEVEAARAYDKAAIEAFGEFAHTNKEAGLL